MKRTVTILFSLLLISGAAGARETIHMINLQEVMSSDSYKQKIGDQVRFYYGKQGHGPVQKKHGEYPTNKKTNAFGKSDSKACNWAFMSAVISLRDRAIAEGGNAVVNIRSYYKKNEISSETEVECHAGAVIAGVALIGEVVTLP